MKTKSKKIKKIKITLELWQIFSGISMMFFLFALVSLLAKIFNGIFYMVYYLVMCLLFLFLSFRFCKERKKLLKSVVRLIVQLVLVIGRIGFIFIFVMMFVILLNNLQDLGISVETRWFIQIVGFMSIIYLLYERYRRNSYDI